MKRIKEIELKAKVNIQHWKLIQQLKRDAGCIDMQELILTGFNALRFVIDNHEEITDSEPDSGGDLVPAPDGGEHMGSVQ